MDSRLMESGLILNAVGLALFWLLADFSIQHNSPSLYNDSIVLMVVLYVSGLALATSGLLRKGTMHFLHASILLAGSFIIGAVLLWMEWWMIILYSRIYGPADCNPYICDPLFGVPQSLVMPVFLAIGVATPVIVFLGSLACTPSTGHAKKL